jgi:hypothetical protein
LRRRWGVARVYEGTLADQAARLQLFRSQYFDSPAERTDIQAMLSSAGWQAWSPAGGSPIWQWLVNAFANFDQVFGGAPQTQEIAFYETDYTFVAPEAGGPALRPFAATGAEFGGGRMAIYHTAETRATSGRVRTARSTPTTAAPASTPTAQAGFEFTVLHELGHGLVEAVLGGVDRGMLNDYATCAGWFQGHLYDAGVVAVRTAIAAGRAPDAQYRISGGAAGAWNDGRWQEQPISAYMASSLSEDFPEAVAAYAAQPAALRARSPRRYEFIHSRLASFRPALRRQAAQAQTGAAVTTPAGP